MPLVDKQFMECIINSGRHAQDNDLQHTTAETVAVNDKESSRSTRSKTEIVKSSTKSTLQISKKKKMFNNRKPITGNQKVSNSSKTE
jgi:hypothetical protein